MIRLISQLYTLKTDYGSVCVMCLFVAANNNTTKHHDDFQTVFFLIQFIIKFFVLCVYFCVVRPRVVKIQYLNKYSTGKYDSALFRWKRSNEPYNLTINFMKHGLMITKNLLSFCSKTPKQQIRWPANNSTTAHHIKSA